MWPIVAILPWSAPALAQEPRFALDTVFVSRLEPAPGSETAAEDLRRMLEQVLGESFLVIAREDVPDYEDYSAEIYLASCPPGQTFGCAYVIGQRADVEWVVSGTVSANEASRQVTLAIIDVLEARVVFDFSVSLGPDADAAFATGVRDLLGKISRGAGDPHDVRDIDAPTDDRALSPEERAELAATLSAMGGELHAVLGSDASSVALEAPKMTLADLEKYRGRDDRTPWERFGMDEREYVRFRNSGRDLESWRRLRRGRFTSVVASVGGGGGTGPWGQQFDARWVHDSQSLDNYLETSVFQEAESAGGAFSDVEIAFGVHPWVELAGVWSVHDAPYIYLFHSEVEGAPATVNEPERTRVATHRLGVRCNVIALPTLPWHPTAHVGISSWRGTEIDRVSLLPDNVDALPAPSLWLAEAGVGVEVDANRHAGFYVRGMTESVVGGTAVSEFHDGEQVLANPASPDGPRGLGVSIGAGIRVRIGPLVGVRPVAGPDEDEPGG